MCNHKKQYKIMQNHEKSYKTSENIYGNLLEPDA